MRQTFALLRSIWKRIKRSQKKNRLLNGQVSGITDTAKKRLIKEVNSIVKWEMLQRLEKGIKRKYYANLLSVVIVSLLMV